MMIFLIVVSFYFIVVGLVCAPDITPGGVCAAKIWLALGLLLGFVGFSGYFGVLDEIAMGVVLGVGIVVGIGLVLLAGTVMVIEVGERRVALVPAHVRAVSPLAPRTLRWMGGLLPGGQGALWLAEVASTLAEISDKKVRRRYIRSYRRAMPRLVWTGWAEYLSVSRRRELL